MTAPDALMQDRHHILVSAGMITNPFPSYEPGRPSLMPFVVH